MAALAKLSQQERQKMACPEQGTADPTDDLSRICERKAKTQLGEGGGFVDEMPDDPKNLTEARRLVWQMRAGAETRKAAVFRQ